MSSIAAKFNKYRQERKVALEKRKKEREERKAKEREERERGGCIDGSLIDDYIFQFIKEPYQDTIEIKDLLDGINKCYQYAENKDEFLIKTGKTLMTKLVGKDRVNRMGKDNERKMMRITGKDSLVNELQGDPPKYDWYKKLLEKWPDSGQGGGKKRKSRRKSRRKRKRTRRRRRKKRKKSRRRRRR